MNDDEPSRIFVRYQHLIDIAQDFATIVDLDTLLDRIVKASAEACSAEQASILLYDAQRKELRFQYATNLAQIPGLSGMVVPANSVAGWVAENRQAVIIPDVSKDERFFKGIEQATAYPTRSLIAVPLTIHQKLIGVLEVINKTEGEFTLFDQESLMAFASHAAAAIENAYLFQQSDLISELVHELRTPLASISTIAHLLQRADFPQEKKDELAQTIIREINRMNDMTTSFLEMARLEARKSSFHISTFSCEDLVKECQTLVLPRAAQNNLSMEITFEPHLPELQADRDKIKQVLLNLLNNAIKYNRPGGNVRISVSKKWEFLSIQIQDTGVGIPDQELPYLFGKYFRSSLTENTTSGTGLGLYVCKRIIENHGGSISVESQVGVGSTFTVLLPWDKGN